MNNENSDNKNISKEEYINAFFKYLSLSQYNPLFAKCREHPEEFCCYLRKVIESGDEEEKLEELLNLAYRLTDIIQEAKNKLFPPSPMGDSKNTLDYVLGRRE